MFASLNHLQPHPCISFQLFLTRIAHCVQLSNEWIVFREALGPAEETVSLAPQETPAPLDLQDLMDPLDLAE